MEIQAAHSERNQVASDDLVHLVDPFIGTEPEDLPPRTGIAATWFWPKPYIGNTHPGACLPFGMPDSNAVNKLELDVLLVLS